MEAPDYLYRYTSLENLALTLKYHTIRLNPLDLMDDPQEQRTQDVKNLGKFVFVSCWTAEEKEDIPMWKLYTDMRTGVRIRLPKNPFKRMKTTPESLSKIPNIYFEKPKESLAELDTFLDIGELMQKRIMAVQAWSGDILHEVKYTNDMNLLEPKIVDYSEDRVHIHINKLGKYKNEYWKFQKEWRYILVFTKLDFHSGIQNAINLLQLSIGNMLHGTEPPPIRYYDLMIEPNHFKNMEITPSPQMSPGNLIMLDSLIEKYNPTATIKESELKDLL